MKFSIIRILVALIYILFMFVAFYKNGNQLNVGVMIPFVLTSLSILATIFNPHFILPKQFTPLSELSVASKIWRIFFASMAIFWGGIIVFGVVTKTILGEVTAGQLLMGSIFGLVGYSGFMMLRAK